MKLQTVFGGLILLAITAATIFWLNHDLHNLPAWGALGQLIQVASHMVGG